MLTQVSGIINGKSIELEREIGLPSGSKVIVRIMPKRLALEEKRRLIRQLCGAWKNDLTLPLVFAEVDAARLNTLPREVHL